MPNLIQIDQLPVAETEISLYPGELYVYTEGPAPRVWTLLGSCVSVALFSRELKIGAICHAQLAEEHLRAASCVDTCPNQCKRDPEDQGRFRYLSCAFQYMLDALAARGGYPNRLSAYVVGGSEAVIHGSGFFKVGKSNLAMADELLARKKIPVLHQDIGGAVGRTLYFYPATGELLFRYHGQRDYYRFPG